MTSSAPGIWRAIADPAFEAGNGMFGGWTAALMLKAVLGEAEGSASAVTVNFIQRVTPGSALELRTRKLGGGRSVAHWSCELLGEEGSLLAVATIVLTKRRDSLSYCEQAVPQIPEPEALEFSRPPDRFGDTIDMRTALGGDYFAQASSRSVHWEKETSGRPIDAIQLLFLGDIGVPRVFFISEGPRPSSTVTLSLYIHAKPDELAACGDDYIMGDLSGTRVEQSTFGMKKDMWSRGGKLLATTEQLCWFR
jgi:acyl-CoA thioesterase